MARYLLAVLAWPERALQAKNNQDSSIKTEQLQPWYGQIFTCSPGMAGRGTASQEWLEQFNQVSTHNASMAAVTTQL